MNRRNTWLLMPHNFRCPPSGDGRNFIWHSSPELNWDRPIQQNEPENHQKNEASHGRSSIVELLVIMKMKHKSVSVFFLALFCLAASAAAFGQTKTYSDPNLEYTFELPDERWKVTARPSATNNSVEMVFVDRNDGHLEIRKTASPRDTPMADVVREEETKLQFRPGYVAGKEENFAGKLSGSVLNFEYVRAGRAMSGRFYFLRNGDSVYVLKFTGFRDKLRSIRNQTDIIARTFQLAKN